MPNPNGTAAKILPVAVSIFATVALAMAGALWAVVTQKFTYYDSLVEARGQRTSAIESRMASNESTVSAINVRLSRIEDKLDKLIERRNP